MLVDTHAHVNFFSFKDDAKETLQRALDNETWVINVGSQIDTSRQAVELAKQFKQGVYAVVGLHPEHTHSKFVDEEETHFQTREENFDYEAYKKLAQDPKVVGIGECGLDYYRLSSEEGGGLIEQIKQKQKETFLQQIKLAKELNKVLVVHSRSSKGTDDACEDILGILEQELRIKNQELRIVLHSYTGSPDVLEKFLKLGVYVSFNGIITFDKTGNIEKLVKMAPLDKILLETDCPYLAPVPMRGKRNEPLYVKFTAEKLAQIKNLSVDDIAKATTQNAKILFQLT
jgi:TatD DNase family protein